MKLLDLKAGEREIREFHRRMAAADTVLKRHGIRSDRIHGWCGAESEHLSTPVRYNMWYIHISGLLREVWRGERKYRRHGKWYRRNHEG